MRPRPEACPQLTQLVPLLQRCLVEVLDHIHVPQTNVWVQKQLPHAGRESRGIVHHGAREQHIHVLTRVHLGRRLHCACLLYSNMSFIYIHIKQITFYSTVQSHYSVFDDPDVQLIQTALTKYFDNSKLYLSQLFWCEENTLSQGSGRISRRLSNLGSYSIFLGSDLLHQLPTLLTPYCTKLQTSCKKQKKNQSVKSTDHFFWFLARCLLCCKLTPV